MRRSLPAFCKTQWIVSVFLLYRDCFGDAKWENTYTNGSIRQNNGFQKMCNWYYVPHFYKTFLETNHFVSINKFKYMDTVLFHLQFFSTKPHVSLSIILMHIGAGSYHFHCKMKWKVDGSVIKPCLSSWIKGSSPVRLDVHQVNST